jgi:hypothetical protein
VHARETIQALGRERGLHLEVGAIGVHDRGNRTGLRG